MKKSALLMMLLVIALTGCVGESTSDSSSDVSNASSAVGTSGASPKLYVFDCGRIRLHSLELFSIPEGDTDVSELIVPCYMIEHTDGRLLWDGGLESSVADVEGWQTINGFEMRLDKTLADQLAELDLDLGSFDFMAFSHMHFDHVGVADEVENAKLIIQREEYEAAFADPVTVQFFDPLLYENLKDVDRLVWALDEVDRMPSTAYASEVFGLFRSWHNKRALDPTGPWSRLTLTIAYATEAHLFITDVNQSPFNVGTRLELDDFDASQMAELNGRYGAPLTGAEVERFAQLVGGHPYLTQRGFQAIVEHGATYAEIEATASDEDGLYGDHLRRILFLLAQNEERRDVVRKLIRGDSAMDAETFYHLRTAGLLTGASARGAGFRNGLYASYLTRHLS